MKVWLSTSFGNACGIAEMAYYLREAIEAADPTIRVVPDPRWLDPVVCTQDFQEAPEQPDWLILNFHRGLHSRWTPEHVDYWRGRGVRVCTIWHDTVGEQPPDALTLAFHDRADLFVVHEPCEGLPKARVWRQGIPGPEMPTYFGVRAGPNATLLPCFKAYDRQPVIGSVGFPFPWKQYDLLAEATAEAGCALLLIAPQATPEQVAGWQARNPWSYIRTDFVDRREAVSLLAGCDATAFLYSCANTGTSAAIRLGIAARRPVLARQDCRQFRDLARCDYSGALEWTNAATVGQVAHALAYTLDTHRIGSLTHLAEADSWGRLGQRYAAALRGEG